MKKVQKFLCVIVAMFATITSFADTPTDCVYAQDVKASLGGTVEVPICLKNPSYAVRSVQFTMELPDGVSFVTTSGGYQRTLSSTLTGWVSTASTESGKSSNTALVMAYGNDQGYYVIPAKTEDDDMEMMTITLSVDANTTAGSKVVTLKKMTITDGDGGEHTILTGDQSITSNVNVQRAEIIEKMGEGYGLIVEPFTAQDEGTVKTISIKVKNAVAIKSLSFDLKLPKGLLMCDTEFNTTKATLNTSAGTSLTEDLVTNTNYNRDGQPNEVQVTFTGAYPSKGTKKYIDIHTTEVELFTLVTYVAKDEDYVEEQGEDYWPRSIYEMNTGLNELKIENISMTDKDGNVLTGEYVSSVLKGTPTDPNPIVYGDITSANQVTAAIPTGATSVDLSQATASDAVVDAIVENAQTKNANAIVYAPSTYEGTKENVVVADEDGNLSCSSFKMTDGKTMNVPASFKAASASYSRTFESDQNWGTICLPYAVSSTSSVGYYKVSAVASGVLTLEKYETLPANTPALVRKLSGDGIASNAENVEVGGALGDVTGVVTMKGSYADNTKVTDANAYYIRDNKFWKCNGNFIINAFRAYFTVDAGNAKTSVFSIDDDAVTAINALVGESETKINEIYGVNGAKYSDLQKGLNIVKLSNGKTHKIIIK